MAAIGPGHIEYDGVSVDIHMAAGDNSYCKVKFEQPDLKQEKSKIKKDGELDNECEIDKESDPVGKNQ